MASYPQFFKKINKFIQSYPLKTLENGYQSAIKIKEIEDQHFQGKMISADGEGGKSVYDFYKSSLDRELAKINLNLTQLRISNFFELGKNELNKKNNSDNEVNLEQQIREKLHFIESVIGKYRQVKEEKLISLETSQNQQPFSQLLPPNIDNNNQENSNLLENLENRIEQNFNKRKRRYSEEYEQDVLKEIRQLREKRKISIRILALLILVPLLVQIISKNFIYSPIVDYLEVNKVKIEEVRITEEMREEAIEEYRKFRDALEIKQLFEQEKYNLEEKEEKLKDKAKELILEAGYKSQEGIANILADITSLLSFLGIVYFRRRQCRIALDFLSESFLGFNVATQVFLFILLTDIFVGFHSAEGWDVLLSHSFEHLGLPENKAFIGIFIATIPVILDSTFKLLIFNYFSRKSPTAVTILEKMNQ